MYVFQVGNEAYKVRFGYGVLYKSDLIDRVITAVSGGNTDAPAEVLKNLIGLTAELLLAGLQKYHSDRFGYDTDEEKNKRIAEVCDLIDDYEDEHTDASGNRDKDGFSLFNELTEELQKNGFLSLITQTAAEENTAAVPMDHLPKRKKAGANR